MTHVRHENEVTVHAGGPLGGDIRVSAAGGHGRSLVKVSWTQDGEARSDHVEVATHEDALELAHTLSETLAAGRAPDLTRD
jgi:hypothetical protein